MAAFAVADLEPIGKRRVVARLERQSTSRAL